MNTQRERTDPAFLKKLSPRATLVLGLVWFLQTGTETSQGNAQFFPSVLAEFTTIMSG